MSYDVISGPGFDYVKVIDGVAIGVCVDMELGNDEEVLDPELVSEEIRCTEIYLDFLRSLRITMREKRDEET